MRSLLSRLAVLWAALAVGLSLVLPSPLGSWVAGLAAAAAGLSLLIGRRGLGAQADATSLPASAVEEADILQTVAMVVRSAAQAPDLSTALHGVASILCQELGAQGMTTGRFDEASAPPRQARFSEPVLRFSVPPRHGLSAVASEAIRKQCVVSSAASGHAVPVLREGRAVAWLEFSFVELPISAPVLLRLLDLVQLELSAVADRDARPGAGRPVAANEPLEPRSTQPLAPTLTRYAPHRDERLTGGAAPHGEVLDRDALDRLRELDPNGVNRLLERVAKAFECSAARLIPQLREGARSGDCNTFCLAASALKSASASIGAVGLARMCTEIESRGSVGDRDALFARIDTLAANADIVLSVLRGFTAAHP